MSIEHWLSDDGRKAIEKTGWPKWASEESGAMRLWMVNCADKSMEWEIAEETSGAWYGCDNRVALALLRDHARVWLKARYGGITIVDGDGIAEVYNARTGELIARADKIDAALIAAILATE